MSEYLRDEAEPGDLLEIEAPFGSFQLHRSKAPHVFIAGGTGLAPFISMLDAIQAYSGTKPPVTVLFGCADDGSLFGMDMLADARYVLGSPRSTSLRGSPRSATG